MRRQLDQHWQINWPDLPSSLLFDRVLVVRARARFIVECRLIATHVRKRPLLAGCDAMRYSQPAAKMITNGHRMMRHEKATTIRGDHLSLKKKRHLISF